MKSRKRIRTLKEQCQALKRNGDWYTQPAIPLIYREFVVWHLLHIYKGR